MPILESFMKTDALIIVIWIQLLAYSVFKEDDEGIDISLWILIGYLVVLTILMFIRGLI